VIERNSSTVFSCPAMTEFSKKCFEMILSSCSSSSSNYSTTETTYCYYLYEIMNFTIGVYEENGKILNLYLLSKKKENIINTDIYLYGYIRLLPLIISFFQVESVKNEGQKSSSENRSFPFLFSPFITTSYSSPYRSFSFIFELYKHPYAEIRKGYLLVIINLII
jgi:hypothetical protein